MENVNLWFAMGKDENIITINEIDEVNRNDKYFCPICGIGSKN